MLLLAREKNLLTFMGVPLKVYCNDVFATLKTFLLIVLFRLYVWLSFGCYLNLTFDVFIRARFHKHGTVHMTTHGLESFATVMALWTLKT